MTSTKATHLHFIYFDRAMREVIEGKYKPGKKLYRRKVDFKFSAKDRIEALEFTKDCLKTVLDSEPDMFTSKGLEEEVKALTIVINTLDDCSGTIN